MTLLSIKNLRVTFQNFQALKNVDLELKTNESLSLVGESGSGKTTLALSIVNLLPAKVEGEISFNGQDILKYDKEELRSFRKDMVGFVFQDPFSSLNPTSTIGRQLYETTRDKDRSLELLHLCGIDDEKKLKAYPHELSGGQRQRVLLAIAISSNPKLLILDEPTSALDTTLQAQVLKLLREIQTTLRVSSLIITHDLSVAANVSDRIAVIYQGKIVEEGPSEELIEQPLHPYTRLLIDALPNGTKEKRLKTIPGPFFSTSEDDLCPFLARCPIKREICNTKPPLVYRKEKRLCHCWFLGKGNA